MQSTLIAAMISVALVTWLPDAAKAMRQSFVKAAIELNDATGDSPLVVAEGD